MQGLNFAGDPVRGHCFQLSRLSAGSHFCWGLHEKTVLSALTSLVGEEAPADSVPGHVLVFRKVEVDGWPFSWVGMLSLGSFESSFAEAWLMKCNHKQVAMVLDMQMIFCWNTNQKALTFF